MNRPASPPMRVLVVEDSVDDFEMLLWANTQLTDHHVTLERAVDAPSALALLAKGRPPELVLLDINLGAATGFDVLDGIRNDERLRTLPVVAWTSSEIERDIHEAYARGANGYVTKPFGLKPLVTALTGLFGFWCSVARLPHVRSAQ